MIYRVKAEYIESKLGQFYHQLTDGTIFRQRPDGEEIVAAMNRARVTNDRFVHWTQTCHCTPPLKHERETIYDQYFTDIQTHVVNDHETADGKPFMQLLADHVM